MAEEFEGAVDGSGEAGFVAVKEGEGAGVIGEGFEGEGDARGLVDFLEFAFDFGALPGDFAIEEGGFEGPGAFEAPAGDDDLVHEIGLDLVTGREVGDIGIADPLEALRGFVFEDSDLGVQPVGGGVAGGFGFTFDGFGPAGFGSIGAGGLSFAF
jgi:hypothetical protein